MTFDDDAWQKAIEQNLMYVVRMVREAVPHMIKRGGGSVLNITAISAIQPYAGFALSVASWGGVIGYAKTLSIELAPSGINVNTICPGYIETTRLEKVFAAGGEDPDIMRNELIAQVPMGRIGTRRRHRKPGGAAGVAARQLHHRHHHPGGRRPAANTCAEVEDMSYQIMMEPELAAKLQGARAVDRRDVLRGARASAPGCIPTARCSPTPSRASPTAS